MALLFLLAAFSCLTVTEGFGSSPSVAEEVPPPAMGGPVACDIAEPQSPRDVSADAVGKKVSHMLPLGNKQAAAMVHVNTHYHLGAEHMSKGEYDSYEENVVDDEDDLLRRRLLAESVTPGYFCKTMTDGLTEEQKKPYEFQYCKNTEVGRTYEVHWVYSSGGQKLGPGLGGALAIQHNPAIVVQGQVYVLVNDDSDTYADYNLLDGSVWHQIKGEAIKYIGSTTGAKYNNEDVCSPYSINWNVDRKCHLMSAQAFDRMCKAMIEEHDMEADATPHGSRPLVTPELASSEMFLQKDYEPEGN